MLMLLAAGIKTVILLSIFMDAEGETFDDRINNKTANATVMQLQCN